MSATGDRPGVTLKYQWYASGQAINGTAGCTMKLPGKRAGKTITVTVTGLFTGAHWLIVASAKRLAHDELGDLLGRVFMQMIDAIGADRESAADVERAAVSPWRPGGEQE